MKRFLAVAVAVLAVGCGQTSSVTIPDQTSPSIQPTVDRITGTVPVGGIDIKTFVITRSNGALTLTFVDAGPPAGVLMGLGLGVPSGTQCSISQQGQVRPNSTTPVFTTTGVTAGTYCLAIGDVGAATAGPVSYIIDVSHY